MAQRHRHKTPDCVTKALEVLVFLTAAATLLFLGVLGYIIVPAVLHALCLHYR